MFFVVVVLCTDVLKVGVWQLLQDIDDPELRKLAHSLPMTVLRSRATGSTRKYLGAFRRWKAWAKGHALPVFPAQGHHVALYLQHLAKSLESKSAAEEAVNALGWVHSLAGVQPPSSSPFMRATLQGIQRMLAKPVQKKERIMSQMLAELVEDNIRFERIN